MRHKAPPRNGALLLVYTTGRGSAIVAGRRLSPPASPIRVPTDVRGTSKYCTLVSTSEVRELRNVRDLFAAGAVRAVQLFTHRPLMLPVVLQRIRHAPVTLARLDMWLRTSSAAAPVEAKPPAGEEAPDGEVSEEVEEEVEEEEEEVSEEVSEEVEEEEEVPEEEEVSEEVEEEEEVPEEEEIVHVPDQEIPAEWADVPWDKLQANDLDSVSMVDLRRWGAAFELTGTSKVSIAEPMVEIYRTLREG